jgi:hypothetical protein
MSIFYIIALICANTYQSKLAVLHLEHANHVTHVEHVNYLAFIRRQEASKPILAALPVQPIAKAQPIAPVATTSAPTPVVTYHAPPGDYSCSSLESLWVSVGGNPAYEHIAAQIATAESGGNPNAISPTNDYGLWQINGSWGSMASLNPVTNAHSAVTISNDGTNWGAWTTYTSGAYASQC